MLQGNTIISRISGGCLLAAVMILGAPLQASETGAFIGGMFATKLLGSMERRTRAEEMQAYEGARSAQPVQRAAPAPAPSSGTSMSAEQKLNQLDKLAAGGYITPAEYKARRKAILDAM
ncbi:MAG: hypothetical protein PVG38_13565 [Gammaproteobacteria bacterium]|jgi:hypothetical protein